MATSLRRLSEQILRIHERGNPTSDRELRYREVYLLVVQAINRKLKIENFGVNMEMGDYYPPHTVIANYEVAVEGDKVRLPYLECTNVITGGLNLEWQTPDGDAWWTGGSQPWITDLVLGVTVTFEKKADDLVGVTFSNLVWPEGTDTATIQATIAACTGMLDFAGLIVPDNYSLNSNYEIGSYLVGAMSNLSVTATTLSFDYDLYEAEQATELYLAKIQKTNNWIDAIKRGRIPTVGDSLELVNITLDEMNCCEITNADGTATAIVKLPAIPLNLPHGKGVWRVYNPSDPSSGYIPLLSANTVLAYNVSHTGLSSTLAGLTCYEYFNRNTLRFNQTVADMPSTVGLQLLVVDPNELDEYELLPIPPEMEDEVIREVLDLVGVNQVSDEVTDANPSR